MAAAGVEARVKRRRGPRNVEIDLMREEMQREVIGLIGPAAIFSAQLFVPSRKDYFVCNLCTFIAVVSCQLFTLWVLKTAKEYTTVRRMHMVNDTVHHVCRTLCHLLFAKFHNADLLSRLLFLFVAPCDAARLSRHATFKLYMATHLILVLSRFAGNLIEDLPFILASGACCHALLETSIMKTRAEEAAREKSRAMVGVIEEVAQSMLECFCDATARTTSALELTRDSPTLSALLSRRAKSGRMFIDFVNMSDRDQYREFIQSLDSSAGTGESSDVSGKPTTVLYKRDLKVRSIQLHLDDSMNIPFAAHVFHACIDTVDGETVYLIGISESYDPTKAKKSERKRSRSSSERVNRTRLNFESGQLEPIGPAFNSTDMEIMKELQQAAPTPRMRTRSRPRAGSPRPRGASPPSRSTSEQRRAAELRSKSPL